MNKFTASALACLGLFFGAFVWSLPAPAQILTSDEIHHWNLDPRNNSNGYMLGYITTLGLDGQYFYETLEGQIQLGYSSSDAVATDPDCTAELSSQLFSKTKMPLLPAETDAIGRRCSTVTNPRGFSSGDLSMNKQLAGRKGGPVLMYYQDFMVTTWARTHTIIKKVWTVSGDRPLPALSMESYEGIALAQVLRHQKTSVDGRFVDASIRGTIRENFQVTIQVGPSGNNFIDMNVLSEKLFDFIVECMATGRYLRISYYEIYDFQNIFARLLESMRTNYRIYRVDVIGPK